MIRSYAAQPPLAILGVPFDCLATSELRELVSRMIESRRPHYLLTVDSDVLVQAQSNVELRRALFEAHVVLAAGRSLIRAARWLGPPATMLLTGPDLLPLLLVLAQERQLRVFLLGDSEASAATAAARLCSSSAQLKLVGHTGGLTDKAAGLIQQNRPDLLLVASASPRTALWISAHYQLLGVSVAACVSLAAELSGNAAGSPSGGSRLSRAGNLWRFSRAVLRQWWELRFRSPKNPVQVSTPVESADTWQCLKLPPRLDLQATRDDALLVDQVLADGRHCLLDLSGVEFIDSTGVGLLIRLQKKVRTAGKQLVLLAPSPIVQRALHLMHLKSFFATAPNLVAARELLLSPVSLATVNPLRWPDRLTEANSAEVWERTEAHLRALAVGGSDIEVDLTGLRHIDRVGVDVMVRARKLAQLQGCRLNFLAPAPPVLTVLREARLDEFVFRGGGPEAPRSQ